MKEEEPEYNQKEPKEHYREMIRKDMIEITGPFYADESEEDKKLFYICALIDYIARKTKNKRSVIVDVLGQERIGRAGELADFYGNSNLEEVCRVLMKESQIEPGDFDNVGACQYDIPSHWDIGRVYKRLIKQVVKVKNVDEVDAIFEVYHSFISDKIDDYNSIVYCENPDYIFEVFMTDKLPD